jgi:RimJ/RimL family protein N-acetyltransferase
VSRHVPWPVAGEILTARLRLEPLQVSHAEQAFAVLDDVRLHAFTGGSPHSLEELRARYRVQALGQSPDGTQGWLNWMLRRVRDGRLVGSVQATLYRPADGRLEAELAWVVGTGHQGGGYGREGALAMAHWLRAHGVDALVAQIHPGHHASMGIARAVGLAPTDLVSDGEVRWAEPTVRQVQGDGGNQR